MRDDSLSLVSEEVGECTRCPLSLSRTKPVAGDGNEKATVLFVGEGPGRNEDLQGKPFVGAAGKQLETFLTDAGLSRADVYITNVVKCRPLANRRPTEAEVEACRPYLERQLSLISPKVVVLLGETALKRFLPKENLSGAHGKLFQEARFAIFPTYHPAAMIYNRSLEQVIREDFRALARILSRLRAETGP